jgi:hypothetical protein
MPFFVMESLGMECTKYYETCEIIYAIDSRKYLAYGEIKYFCAWICATPHITIVFTIIVVDLPLHMVFPWSRDWCSMIGGYIMNDGICMMLPNKYGTMIRVPREKGSQHHLKRNKLK